MTNKLEALDTFTPAFIIRLFRTSCHLSWRVFYFILSTLKNKLVTPSRVPWSSISKTLAIFRLAYLAHFWQIVQLVNRFLVKWLMCSVLRMKLSHWQRHGKSPRERRLHPFYRQRNLDTLSSVFHMITRARKHLP